MFEFIALQFGFVPQPLFSKSFYNHNISNEYEELLDARSKEMQENAMSSKFFDGIHPSGVNIYESSKRPCHISISGEEMQALSRNVSTTEGIARTDSRDSQNSSGSKKGSKNKDGELRRLNNDSHGGVQYPGKEGSRIQYPFRLSFPPSCMFILRNLSGNDQCADCGEAKPDIGNIHYGVLVCRQCAETHVLCGFKVCQVYSFFCQIRY
jgi:hypothetical protein